MFTARIAFAALACVGAVMIASSILAPWVSLTRGSLRVTAYASGTTACVTSSRCLYTTWSHNPIIANDAFAVRSACAASGDAVVRALCAADVRAVSNVSMPSRPPVSDASVGCVVLAVAAAHLPVLRTSVVATVLACALAAFSALAVMAWAFSAPHTTPTVGVFMLAAGAMTTLVARVGVLRTDAKSTVLIK